MGVGRIARQILTEKMKLIRLLNRPRAKQFNKPQAKQLNKPQGNKIGQTEKKNHNKPSCKYFSILNITMTIYQHLNCPFRLG